MEILPKNGIKFLQVVNSLSLKVKEILIFAVQISIFLEELDKAVLCVCSSHKSHKLAQGKFESDRENTGNLKMQFELVPCVLVTGSFEG